MNQLKVTNISISKRKWTKYLHSRPNCSKIPNRNKRNHKQMVKVPSVKS